MPELKPPALTLLRQRIARWIAPAGKPGAAPQRRQYAAARSTRTTAGFGSAGNSSADAELANSLGSLRSRSRQMVRDSSYAKRAKLVVINNVIGSGVGMQAQVTTSRGDMAERVNAGIEAAWSAWCAADQCHSGGAMHFHDIERAALGQVFEAGEVFIRKHYRSFGASRVPLGLELIEPERLADEHAVPGAMETRNEIRMGVEVDEFGRAVAYWVRNRHPGDIRSRPVDGDRYERVPAADVYHLRIVDRWPQTRGEPWMHTSVRKLDDMAEYSQHEVSAARASAAYFATITTPDAQPLDTETDDASGQQMMDIEPLTIQELKPGEKLDFHTPNRPNPGMDPFMRAMLREVAAGCSVSYESISRDYSQSNYSSSRLSLLEDRDLYKTLQQWWIRSFRQPLHGAWLQQAVLAGAVAEVSVAQYAADATKFEAVLFKPRGWQWVDPTKEVKAYKEAILAGFLTVSDVIAQTGGGLDLEDYIKVRRRELKLLAAAGIKVDTTFVEPTAAAAPGAPDAADHEDGEDTPAATKSAARVVPMQVRAA